MSIGVPGYDFEASELVTAAKLRQWLENATWTAVDETETDGTFLGYFVKDTDPGGSEGRIWHQPPHQVTRVMTRWGWTQVLNPFTWETRRFRPDSTSNFIGFPREIHSTGRSDAFGTTNPCFTLGTCVLGLSTRINTIKGDHNCLGCYQSTGGTDSNDVLRVFGLALGYNTTTVHPGHTTQIKNTGSALSEMTDATQGPHAIVGTWLDDETLPTQVSNAAPVFLYGGAIDIVQA